MFSSPNNVYGDVFYLVAPPAQSYGTQKAQSDIADICEGHKERHLPSQTWSTSGRITDKLKKLRKGPLAWPSCLYCGVITSGP